jgi:hypothetical protein
MRPMFVAALSPRVPNTPPGKPWPDRGRFARRGGSPSRLAYDAGCHGFSTAVLLNGVDSAPGR